MNQKILTLILLTTAFLIGTTETEAKFAPKVIRSFPYYIDNPKSLSLTIDDGPDPSVTPRILDLLKEHNVKATFFLVGQNAEQNRDIVERMIREGHVIANHTYTHRQFLAKENPDGSLKCYNGKCRGLKDDNTPICDSLDVVKPEILSTDSLLQGLLENAKRQGLSVQKRLYFRPPGGGWCRDDVPYSQALNQYPSLSQYAGPVYWQITSQYSTLFGGYKEDTDEMCWTDGVSVEDCANGYMKNITRYRTDGTLLRDGGVILVHDIHMESYDLLKIIVPQLIKKGYKFITLEQDPNFDKEEYGQ